MQITYKSQANLDQYYFYEIRETNSILLAEDISLGDLICFIKSSLDQIKPVVLLNSPQYSTEIDFKNYIGFHTKHIDQEFLYLNYSIRNVLDVLKTKTFKVKNFSDVQSIIHDILQK